MRGKGGERRKAFVTRLQRGYTKKEGRIVKEKDLEQKKGACRRPTASRKERGERRADSVKDIPDKILAKIRPLTILEKGRGRIEIRLGRQEDKNSRRGLRSVFGSDSHWEGL